MAKNTQTGAQATVEPETETTEVAAVETFDNAQIVDGVLVSDVYDFSENDYGMLGQDEMAIGHLFQPGFNPEPYDFRWIRHNGIRDAERRYLIKVTKAHHSRWFQPEAFHPVYGAIVCGERFMNGSQPEFYLMVRPKAALDAEIAAQVKVNKSRQDVEDNSEFKAVTSQMGQALGSHNVTGGVSKVSRSSWQ